MEDNEIAVEKEPQGPPIVEQDEFELLMQPRWVTIHCVARCRDCDFYEDDFKTAWDAANKHCDATGHRMIVEKGISTSTDYSR